MLIKILLKIAVNAAALYVASVLIDGVHVETSFATLAFLGMLLWLGNAIVRPILKLFTFPLIFLTFGLFNLVINAFILWGVDILAPQLEIVGVVSLLLATLAVSLAGSLLFFI
jgi:putative membrane protein